jgi:hypothetical protein
MRFSNNHPVDFEFALPHNINDSHGFASTCTGERRALKTRELHHYIHKSVQLRHKKWTHFTLPLASLSCALDNIEADL